MSESEVIKWLFGVFNLVLGFFLYTIRDRLKEYKQEQAKQDTEINNLKTELHLMKNVMVTDKELTGYLGELKKEVKEDLKEISKSMNDHREESSRNMSELRNIVTRLAVLMEQEKSNGTTE